jgi:Protein of unknown function (DUF1573)
VFRVLDGGTAWALGLLLLTSGVVVGYLAFERTPVMPTPAVVSVSPDVADFGTVGQGEFRVAEFQIFNPLAEPLEMLDVKTSCTCTKFDLEPRHIAPGSAGKVTLNWSSSNRRGELDLSATLVVKFPDDRVVGFPLNIHAEVEPDIRVSPSVVEFTADKSEVRRVTLSPGRMGDFQVKQTYSSHSSLTVRPVTGDPRSFDLVYTPTPGGLPPQLTVDLVTDSRHEPTLMVPVVVTGSTPPPVPFLMPGAK